ncbi:MAG: aryl-sulfate sulfotransferase, partial [Solirubrobacterales bacterium]|nr:aryl-sulfate sulfotransferase [Solirubrobacterales bacterium]
FRSRTDLAPAAVVVTTHGNTAPGDIFVAPQYGPVQDGPEILDPNGHLIWFKPLGGDTSASDVRVQTFHGAPVLTWWQGYVAAGVGIGEGVINNTAYQQIATVKAGNGLSADLHEFELTRAGEAVVVAEYPVFINASSVHGSTQQNVLDSVVQEIDVPTGLVLFQWDSLDHVSVNQSYQPPPAEGPKVGVRNPYDYFHINSIQLDGDGSLIISARNTWAAYKIDHRTGAVIWTLGGKQSSFRMLGASGFAFQHDARVHGKDDRYVTVFDDGAGLPIVHKYSRGLELYLDLRHHNAHVFKQWHHSPALSAFFEGNVQQLPDADEFVGWGQDPYFSEYDQRGRTILDGRFVSNTASYRAYRFAWTGTPAAPPALSATASGNRITWYVSWNGATAVSSWRALAGSTPDDLRPVASARKTSFETSIGTPREAYAELEALDASGHELGASALVNVR